MLCSKEGSYLNREELKDHTINHASWLEYTVYCTPHSSQVATKGTDEAGAHCSVIVALPRSI